VDHNIFRPFFRVGREFDANFIYEISFGFTPRQYKNSADDRYMFEEEGDVSEVIFIMSGEWGVAYNSYVKPQDIRSIVLFDDMTPPEDMSALGYVIAQKKSTKSYIGDYYCLSNKRSQFFYVALSHVETFSLTKEFLLKQIFAKFPGLHQEMMSEAFCRYIKEFRKPCNKKRKELIELLNKKLHYSQI
jgi:hypothetical protein